MGHIGLTPQSIHALGGFKVQGKQLDAAQALADDAVALAEAGCFAIVLECVPDARRPHDHRVGRASRRSASAPAATATARCSCGTTCSASRPGRRRPKFVRAYAELERDATEAIEQFCADVRAGTFPSSAETYHMTDQMAEALGLYGGTTRRARAHAVAPVPIARGRRDRGRRSRDRGRVVGDRHRGARGALACRRRAARGRRAARAATTRRRAAPFAGLTRGARRGRRPVPARASSPTHARSASQGLRDVDRPRRRTTGCCSCSTATPTRAFTMAGHADPARHRVRTPPTARRSTARA